MQNANNLTNFTFTGDSTLGGSASSYWVIVNADGSLNNNGTGGGTLPMLASEYSTTINNTHQLQLVAMNLGASYTLNANINASGTGGGDVWANSTFVPIGNSDTPFTGAFNGLSHTISNLTINLSESTGVGLFGYTDTNSVIQNVGLVGGSVNGYSSVGELVGQKRRQHH